MSIYIHIPFCSSICSYCDFAKVYYNEKIVNDYINVLKEEIKNNYKDEKIKTLYFGGGTPSSLNIEQLNNLFEILKDINFIDNPEITFECNIENIDEEKIKLLKQNKVNRISIGVQTFNNKYLKFLNRNHTFDEINDKINMIRKYIENINVDLMYAFPNQTILELKEDIKNFKKLDIPHISTYSLIIEPHTILGNKKIKNIDEDLDFEMYMTIKKELASYTHYETSNYSKAGYESRHNLTYWNNQEYYGFGCGASGYINNKRYENTRNLNKYLKKEFISSFEEISTNTKIENEFILGFRKINGISIKDFIKKYNINPTIFKQIKKLLESEKLILEDDNLKIHPDYLYLSNEILIELINENYEKNN